MFKNTTWGSASCWPHPVVGAVVWALLAPGSRSEWLRVPLGSCPAPPESFTRLCKQAAEPSPDSTRFATSLAAKCVYPGEAGMGAPWDTAVCPCGTGCPRRGTAPCQPYPAARLKLAWRNSKKTRRICVWVGLGFLQHGIVVFVWLLGVGFFFFWLVLVFFPLLAGPFWGCPICPGGQQPPSFYYYARAQQIAVRLLLRRQWRCIELLPGNPWFALENGTHAQP